jgi:hypothetical protein
MVVVGLSTPSRRLGVRYDVLVMAPGSIARCRLEAADATIEARLRRKLSSFMVIGGGYAGIEVLGELEDMARYTAKRLTGRGIKIFLPS